MNSRTNYSDFWFDRQTSLIDDLLADDTDTEVKVKPKKDYIQMAANQRAIGNFVRIVSGKNIPVRYMTRGDSYTDGKSVTIGANIKPETFDFTVGLTRYAASQKTLKLPAKFSSFGGVWRYDEPQKGRYRFFHQWNIETFGNLNTEHDAEIIEFTSRFFDNLTLSDIVIDINHRKLAQSNISQIYETNETTILHQIIRTLNKTQKKSKHEKS